MKLYTEEQVRQAMQNAMIPSIYQMDLWGQLTPIELPSDEEIKKEINSDIHIKSDADYFNGAKWVIEQIKQQDNGKI